MMDPRRHIFTKKTLSEKIISYIRTQKVAIAASAFSLAVLGGAVSYVSHYDEEKRRYNVVPIRIWKQGQIICLTAGDEAYIVDKTNVMPEDGRNSLYEKTNKRHAHLLRGNSIPNPEQLLNIDVALNVANDRGVEGNGISDVIHKIREGTDPSTSGNRYQIIPGVERERFGKTYSHKGKKMVNSVGYGNPLCK